MDVSDEKRVLVIEDDAFFRELLAQNLSQKNFRVTAIENGAAAERLLEEESFDVVCFDIVVSGSDGLKSVSEFATGERQGNTALLLLVDKGLLEGVRAWADGAGAAVLVKQESSPEEIVAAILALAR